MALDIPSGFSVSFAVSGAEAASRLRRSSPAALNGPNALALGEGTAADRFVERRVSINTETARQGLRQSVYAAQTIREALSELAGLAALAAQGGLTSNSTQLLSADGTRVSRGNIQAQLDRAVALINSLVDASAVGNANFIDGGGPAIRIQTSRFGGSVDILPQGLDTFSLGLANLDVSTQADAELSRARLESAFDTAGSRINRLVQLQSALGQTSAFDQSLIAATTNISGALPVGAFINLSA